MERAVIIWFNNHMASGNYRYRKRQVSMLRQVFEWCFFNNPKLQNRVVSIGRRDLAAWWAHSEMLGHADSTRSDYHRILVKFFTSGVVKNPPKIPQPRIQSSQNV